MSDERRIMHISKVHLENAKCFKRVEVSLEPGINVIVGKNNSGKSTFLKAIKGIVGSNDRHRSLTKPNSTLEDPQVFNLSFGLTQIELREELVRLDRFLVPYPPQCGFDKTENGLNDYLNWMIFQSDTSHSLSYEANSPCLESLGRHSEWRGSSMPELVQAKITETQPLRVQHLGETRTSWNQEFTHRVHQELRQRIYLFGAERTIPETAKATFGGLLDDRCSNLAQVLSVLSTNNIDQYEKFVTLCRRIFPDVSWITPLQGNREKDHVVRIKIFFFKSNRGEQSLSVGLDDCGTGLGQVLAICYLLATSEIPRVILIDEPQSFLHPEASRKLMLLLEEFQQHQFLVSTHSPEVIGAVTTCSVHHIVRDEDGSKIRSIGRADTNKARELLLDLGVSLRDVFGLDKVLWVEGETEEIVFPEIIRAFGKQLLPPGLVIKRVFATGDVDQKKNERALHVYTSLANAEGLIPPMICLLLDRERKTEEEVKKQKELANGLIEFLPVPMVENYVLDVQALHYLVSERLNGIEGVTIPSIEQIRTEFDQTVEEAKSNVKLQIRKPKSVEEPIHNWIHAAGVIDSVLSKHSIPYCKPKDFQTLVRYFLNTEPERLRGLFDFLAELLQR